MPCENCVSRREFLSSAAGATGFIMLGACGDGDVSGIGSPVVLPVGPVVITVGDFPELAAAGVLVQVPQKPIAVKRLDASSFRAISMVCTHQGCGTRIVNGQRLDCPCHSSRFTSDGAVINGPFTGESIGPLLQLATAYDPATDELTIT